MRALAIACLLLLGACKQDCETICQQQLGCATTHAPDAAVRVGPTCEAACADGSYHPSEECVTCLDSHGICTPEDGGYRYEGCEGTCPAAPALR